MSKKEDSNIRIQAFSSKGRVSRVLGRKSGKIHHLLSDLETNMFLILDFDRNVSNIIEHYPLKDVRDVIDDKNIDWNKFKDKKTKEDYIITTTFLVTLINGKNIAISCKNQSELYKSNTQLKLEIERRYWSYKGVQWGIITNKELPKNRLKNIKWIMLGEEIDEEMYFKISSIILETIEELDGKLSDYIEWISKRYGFSKEEVLTVVKEMIKRNNLEVDLDKEILIDIELQNLKISR